VERRWVPPPTTGARDMADEKPSLHIDTDWKKQAQEEKRRLAEQEEQRRAAAATRAPSAPVAPIPGTGTVEPTPSAGAAPAGPAGASGASATAEGRGEMPVASLGSLVQSIVTQILFYLGDLAPRGGQPTLNLDLAKHNIDLLGVIEEKTKGNLTDDENRLIDAALYETRMRYVSVASQFIT
ncbi:MAG: DUF1844 domain-containing protein, partial [Tepidisphaeraceae bacterium]